MVAIFLVMAGLFLIIGILSAVIPYESPRLKNLSNYDRVRFGAFREGFQNYKVDNETVKAYNE